MKRPELDGCERTGAQTISLIGLARADYHQSMANWILWNRPSLNTPYRRRAVVLSQVKLIGSKGNFQRGLEFLSRPAAGWLVSELAGRPAGGPQASSNWAFAGPKQDRKLEAGGSNLGQRQTGRPYGPPV